MQNEIIKQPFIYAAAKPKHANVCFEKKNK